MSHGKRPRYPFDKRLWPTECLAPARNRTQVVHTAVSTVRRLAAAEADVCIGFTGPSGDLDQYSHSLPTTKSQSS
jgi:hypothetical protein